MRSHRACYFILVLLLACLGFFLSFAPLRLTAQQLSTNFATPTQVDSPPRAQFLQTDDGAVPAQFTVTVGTEVTLINSQNIVVAENAPLPPGQLLEDFSQSAVGAVPSGWSLMGSAQFTPTVQESGGVGPEYHVLDFPEVGWEYWDKWAIRNGLAESDVYTAQVKLRFLNDVADRAGLTIALDRNSLNRIDIQANVFHDNIEFRSSFGGIIGWTVPTLDIDSGVDYWLRAVAESRGASAGTVTVLWSTDGTTFTKVLVATELSNVHGEAGVSTAGPHLPRTLFDDFTLTIAPNSPGTDYRVFSNFVVKN